MKPKITYLDLWQAGNDAGNGYPVGSEGDDINDLDIGTLLQRADTNQDVAVYRTADGGLVAVGDANGPWAVDISARDDD